MAEPKMLSEIIESKVSCDKQPTMSPMSTWINSHWRKILAEFFCTMMLVFLGCMTCIPMEGFESPLYQSIGFGMIVLFIVQIFGHVSGALINPIVSLASVIIGRNSLPLGLSYAVANFTGAIVGYGMLIGLSPVDLLENGVCVTRTYPGSTALQSIGIEAAITATLIFFNCSMWDPENEDQQDSASIKFGLTVVGLGVVAGPFTGASMNPARSLAPALWNNDWSEYYVYSVGPLLGCLLTSTLYKYIFLEKPLKTIGKIYE